MFIIDERNELTNFEDIKVGTVFIFEGRAYLKLKCDHYNNAFNLCEDEIAHLSPASKVVPRSATLTLRG